MSIALKRPENKDEIKRNLVWLHGSVSQAAVVYDCTFGVMRNLLTGTTPFRRHQGIVTKINADTGADMAAWEK